MLELDKLSDIVKKIYFRHFRKNLHHCCLYASSLQNCMLESKWWGRSFIWIQVLIASDADQAERAHSQELLSTLIRECKTTQNLGKHWVFRYSLLSKKFFVLIIYSLFVMNQPGPAQPLYYMTIFFFFSSKEPNIKF